MTTWHGYLKEEGRPPSWPYPILFEKEQEIDTDVLVIGGGIGGAPLRPVIQTVLNNRQEYGRLTIFWAAREPSLLLFKDEYETWQDAVDTNLHLTVDQADDSWDGEVLRPGPFP